MLTGLYTPVTGVAFSFLTMVEEEKSDVCSEKRVRVRLRVMN